MSKDWKTPPGLTQGTWDYVRARQIASGYDQFLKQDRLVEFDTKLLERLFKPVKSGIAKPMVADFGAGIGRCLLPLCQRGYRGLAVDLSENMLRVLHEKIEGSGSLGWRNDGRGVYCLQANLVELDGIASGVADHGICMFSTLGMINGREFREQFLRHARRIIKPGGMFIVHAHNYWFQLRHPGGFRWVVSNIASSIMGPTEIGDRYCEYRGVNQMFIHSFRKREIRNLLEECGFEIREVVSFKDQGRTGWLSDVGWFFVCK